MQFNGMTWAVSLGHFMLHPLQQIAVYNRSWQTADSDYVTAIDTLLNNMITACRHQLLTPAESLYHNLSVIHFREKCIYCLYFGEVYLYSVMQHTACTKSLTFHRLSRDSQPSTRHPRMSPHHRIIVQIPICVSSGYPSKPVINTQDKCSQIAIWCQITTKIFVEVDVVTLIV